MFKQFGHSLFSTSLTVIKYGCIFQVVINYGVNFMVCRGPSMEPTLNENDAIFTERVSVLMKTIKKGDVVIVTSPTNPRKLFCKRVVAMEGDRIYAAKKYRKIPHGHVWLEGDNKRASYDSRTFGPVPYGLVRSRVYFKFLPIHDMGLLRMPGER